MKAMKMPSRFAFRFRSFVMLTSLATSLLVGCPAGTKTTVEAGIIATIDPSKCSEVRPDAGAPAVSSGDTLLLDCANLTGSGTIRIEFPRKAWWDAKLSRVPSIDAGPGK
jgi:hypothetical protein